MRNPYDVLGASKGATEAELKKLYRKAAKLHHPDRNRDDPRAAERFAELNTAYEILGDGTKRGQFDRGEIDGDGKPKSRGFDGFGKGGFPGGGFPGGGGQSAEDIFRQFNNMGRGGGQGAGGQGAGGFDASDVFGRMFGDTAQRARGGGNSRPQPQPGVDASVSMVLTLEEITEREPKLIKLPTGRDLEVAIPKTVTDGMTVRLRGQGYSSPTGGEPGDAMLTIRVKKHDVFTVDGKDLRARLTVPLVDAVLGGPVTVPTLGGGVEMNIPAMTSSGKTFRLRGKGMPGADGVGDLYATVEIILPSEPDAELTALMQKKR
jgi:DnaJ-class molecular chaperone